MKENRRKERLGFRTDRCLVLYLAALTSILLHVVSPLTYAATSFSATNLTANNSVTAGYTIFSRIQLNDVGQAVFSGGNPTTGRADVFFWDGTTLKNITANIPGFVVFGSINLNQKGQIVFIASTNFDLFRNFPFFYDGTSVRNLANSLPPSTGANVFGETVINDSGLVAFSGCQAAGSVGACLQPSVFLFNGSVSNIFVDNVTSGIIVNLSINSRGHVAWSDHQAGGVGFFDGTSVRDLTADPVAKGAGYFQFSNPKLNNADQIIFGAAKFGRSDMLFFDGSTLKNLTETAPAAGGAGFASFDLPALNNAGKAAFVGQELNRPDTSETFFFDGTVLKNLTGADPVTVGAGFNYFLSLSPQMNSMGQLAFVGSKLFLADSEAIFFFDGTSLTNVTGNASLAGGVVTRINNASHLAFFGKDGSTTSQRFQDIFFFDGTSIPQNLTSGNSLFSDYSFKQSLQEFNNNDQILALGFRADRTDGTNDVFLLSPSGTTLADADGDGMPDVFEIVHGLNPNDPNDANLDADIDGLTNLREFQLGTNPKIVDTDGDGVPDGTEVARGTNPLDPNSFPPPSVPTGLTGVVGTQSAILYWKESEENIDGWNVYGKEASASTFLNLNDPTKPYGQLTGPMFPVNTAGSTPPIILDQGKTFDFTVKAVKNGIESVASNIFRMIVPAPQPTKPDFPVIFLHGVASDAGAWDEFKSFVTGTYGWTFGGELTVGPNSPEQTPLVTFTPGSNPQDGTFYTVNFRANGKLVNVSSEENCRTRISATQCQYGQANYQNNLGVYNEGLEVAAFLRKLHEVRGDGGARKFIIVAHSAGGLAARAYIQPRGTNTPSNIVLPVYGNDVAHLITYGSPHLGIDVDRIDALRHQNFNALVACASCGYLPLLSRLIDKLYRSIDETSEVVDQLTSNSPFLNDLNSRPFPDIKYTALIGGSVIASFLIIPTGELHDGLVSSASQDISSLIPQSSQVDVLPSFRLGSPGGIIGYYDVTHSHETEDTAAILEGLSLRSPFPPLVFIVGSPIDIVVTAPDGKTIGKQLTEIPGGLYHEYDIDLNGEPNDVVIIPFAKPGDYKVKVLPVAGASPTDTYTLEATQNGQTVVLAQNQQIQNIPSQGYTVTVPKDLKSLAPAKLWVGLKNSDDQGTFFDVRVEVLKNGSVIASGVSKNIQGVTRNPDKAKEVTVAFGSISNGEVSSGDILSLRVLAKVADSGGHSNAVGLRLYYDAVSRPSGFGAEITPDPLKSFFLRTVTGDFLDSTSPTGKTPKQKDSLSVDRKTFKEIGTWSMTVP